jgi:hypothetical protein
LHPSCSPAFIEIAKKTVTTKTKETKAKRKWAEDAPEDVENNRLIWFPRKNDQYICLVYPLVVF